MKRRCARAADTAATAMTSATTTCSGRSYACRSSVSRVPASSAVPGSATSVSRRDAEVQRQRPGLHHRRAAQRDAVDAAHHPLVRPLGVDDAEDPRGAALHPAHPLAQHEEHGAGGERQQRQQQRGRDAVPQREVLDLLGVVRPGVGLHQRVGQPGHESEHEPGEPEDRDRCDERQRRLVRLGVVAAGLARERAPDEAGAVRRRQHRAGEEPSEHQQVRRRAARERLVRRVLRDEAEQRRHAGHRQRGQRGDGREHRHPAGQAGQQAQVAGTGLVVDDADGEEQRRLEQPVREQQRGAGQRRLVGAAAEQDQQEAELADGAEGEQPLEVDLPERSPAADEHRRDADGDDRRAGRVHDREGGREPGHEVDAGLHHRRRVQVRRHRCRCGHRGGQPGVERHLRALGERADQDQHQRDRRRRARTAGRPGRRTATSCRPAARAAPARRA